MDIIRETIDYPVVIIQKDIYEEEHRLAKLNKEEIKHLAEEKYLEYIKNNSINVTYEVQGLKSILRGSGIIYPTGEYEEFNYSHSIDYKMKHNIVNNIASSVDTHFKNWRNDVREYANNIILKYEKKQKNIKNMYFTICLIFMILCIAEGILLAIL